MVVQAVRNSCSIRHFVDFGAEMIIPKVPKQLHTIILTEEAPVTLELFGYDGVYVELRIST